jgi:hypothetical protein
LKEQQGTVWSRDFKRGRGEWGEGKADVVVSFG